jgi:hypothetical protein
MTSNDMPRDGLENNGAFSNCCQGNTSTKIVPEILRKLDIEVDTSDSDPLRQGEPSLADGEPQP